MFTLLVPQHPTGFDTPSYHPQQRAAFNPNAFPGRHGSYGPQRRPHHHRRESSYYETEPEYPSFDFGLNRARSTPAFPPRFQERASYYPEEYDDCEGLCHEAPRQRPAVQQRQSLTEVQLRALLLHRQQEQEEARAREQAAAAEQHLHRRGAIRRKTEDERLAELEAERSRILARKAEREAREAAEAERERAALAAAQAAKAAEEERQRKIRKMKEVHARHQAERRAAYLQAVAEAQAQAEQEAQRRAAAFQAVRAEEAERRAAAHAAAQAAASEQDSEVEGQRREAQRLVVETFLGELLGLFLDNDNDATNDNATGTAPAPVDVKGKGKAREEAQPEPQREEKKVRFRGERAGPSYSPKGESQPVPTPVAPAAENVTAAVPATEPTTVPARPESPARDLALQHVQLLLAKFESLTYSFAFPRVLSFSTTDSPTLAYTAQNAPVHTYEHALNGLLQELDGIDSEGDGEVRKVRRELVRRVEKELGWLELEVRRAWERANATEPEPEVTSDPEVEAEEVVAEQAEQAVAEITPATESTEVEQSAAPAEGDKTAAESTEDATTGIPEADDFTNTKAALNNFLDEATAPETEEPEAAVPAPDVEHADEHVTKSDMAAEEVRPVEEALTVVSPAVETAENPTETVDAVKETVETEESPAAPEPTVTEPTAAAPSTVPIVEEPESPAANETSPLLSGAFVPVPVADEVSHEEESEDEEQVIAESSSAEVEDDISEPEAGKSVDGYELI